jgi:predicted ATP-grasp superfamily ATP-dependent carboligase
MDNGNVLAQFAHRRVREKPPTGGLSVLCESIEPPELALNAAKTLLKKLRWSGVAMVEFKEDLRDKTPKLMEVNARFWGSLQLAISAGVDFPYLLFQIAAGAKIDGAGKYRLGVRSRWELGDLDHLLIRLKEKPSKLFLPSDAPSKMGAVKNFLVDFLRPSVRNEILRPNDMRPFRFELKEYLKSIIKKKM